MATTEVLDLARPAGGRGGRRAQRPARRRGGRRRRRSAPRWRGSPPPVRATPLERWTAADPYLALLVHRAVLDAQAAVEDGARDALRIALERLSHALAALGEAEEVGDARTPKELARWLAAAVEVPQRDLADAARRRPAPLPALDLRARADAAGGRGGAPAARARPARRPAAPRVHARGRGRLVRLAAPGAGRRDAARAARRPRAAARPAARGGLDAEHGVRVTVGGRVPAGVLAAAAADRAEPRRRPLPPHDRGVADAVPLPAPARAVGGVPARVGPAHGRAARARPPPDLGAAARPRGLLRIGFAEAAEHGLRPGDLVSGRPARLPPARRPAARGRRAGRDRAERRAAGDRQRRAVRRARGGAVPGRAAQPRSTSRRRSRPTAAVRRSGCSTASAARRAARGARGLARRRAVPVRRAELGWDRAPVVWPSTAAGSDRQDSFDAGRLLIAVGVALALADASVVTLALPPMLVDLDTTVEGVAAVIGVYTLVLAALLPWPAWLRRRVADAVLGAAGFGAVRARRRPVRDARTTSARCSRSARCRRRAPRRRWSRASRCSAAAGLWTAAAVFGTAVGPALGGALTQAFDWRAIFLFQCARPGAAAGRASLARGMAGARAGAAAVAAHGPRGALRRPPAATGALVALAAAVGGAHRRAVPARAAARLRLVARAARRRGGGVGAARRGVRRRADPRPAPRCAQAPAARWSAAACSRSRRCRAPVGGSSRRSCSRASAWAWRCRRSAASCCPSARRAGRLAAVGPPCGHHARARADRAGRGRAARRRRVRRARARRGADARRGLPPLDKIELAGPLRRRPRPGRPARRPAPALDAEAGRFADDPEQRAGVRRADRARGRDAGRGIEDGVPGRVRDRRRAGAGRRGRGAPARRQRRTVAIAGARRRARPAGGHAMLRPQVAPEPVGSPTRARRASCPHRRHRRLRPGRGAQGARPRGVPLRLLARGARARARRRGRRARAYERAHGVDPRSTGGLLDVLGISLG